MGKRIAIVGTASSSIGYAPWSEPDTEIWAVSSIIKLWAKLMPLVDVFFELHENFEQLRPEFLPWAIENQPKIYMCEEHPDLDNSIAYPREQMEKQFARYFTSSVAYMLALAISEIPDCIGIYGVDMATAGEYYDQRPCCEFFLGVAAGMGIDVEIPKSSALLKSPLPSVWNHQVPSRRASRGFMTSSWMSSMRSTP